MKSGRRSGRGGGGREETGRKCENLSRWYFVKTHENKTEKAWDGGGKHKANSILFKKITTVLLFPGAEVKEKRTISLLLNVLSAHHSQNTKEGVFPAWT